MINLTFLLSVMEQAFNQQIYSRLQPNYTLEGDVSERTFEAITNSSADLRNMRAGRNINLLSSP
jgi:hypothetical protein